MASYATEVIRFYTHVIRGTIEHIACHCDKLISAHSYELVNQLVAQTANEIEGAHLNQITIVCYGTPS